MSDLNDECGAVAVGGSCILPRGHNMGNLDIPSNHHWEAKSQLPTVTLSVASRGYGKTQALIESLLQQADARGLRVEIVEPTHTVEELTEKLQAAQEADVEKDTTYAKAHDAQVKRIRELEKQLQKAEAALAAIARLMSPARTQAILGISAHVPVPVADQVRVLDYTVQRTKAIRAILADSESKSEDT